MDYRRHFVKGGCYFFTLVTEKRRPLLNDNIERLRASFRYAKDKLPFDIQAIVVLPDHLHMVMCLPEGDADFPARVSYIKRYFSTGFPSHPDRSSLRRKREKGRWQRRYWEHCIRDEDDWRRHVDYIHFNPVKHNYVKHAGDWQMGSFQKSVALGWYEPGWGSDEPDTIVGFERE